MPGDRVAVLQLIPNWVYLKTPVFVIAGLTRNLEFTTRLRLGGRNNTKNP